MNSCFIRSTVQCGKIRHVKMVSFCRVKYGKTKKDFACKTCGKIYTAQSDIYEYSRFLPLPICGERRKKTNTFK